MDKPVVSVIMVTYAHEKYILEAINGVLMQQCDFEVELIIANDCSPDSTDEIIHSTIQNHPRGSWIRYFNHEKNLGMLPNFIFALQQCQGKYIALCEGDDYWNDPLKLQKQVNFLEANVEYSGCFHNSEERYWNNYSKASRLFVSYSSGCDVTIHDLSQKNIIPTASVIFKKPLFEELYSKEYLSFAMGDWPLHLLNTRNGNYYYLPQVMSVRHLHINSVWGMKDNEDNVKKMLVVYNMLIQSGWFVDEVVESLKNGAERLGSSIIKKDVSSLYKLKRKVIKLIIKFLNDL